MARLLSFRGAVVNDVTNRCGKGDIVTLTISPEEGLAQEVDRCRHHHIAYW